MESKQADALTTSESSLRRSERGKILSLSRTVGLAPLAHQPPLPLRQWFYVAAAYLIPVVLQVAFPNDPTYSDELVWLITLVPAFLLSLYHGLRGAFAALIMGTLLFGVVEAVVALYYTPDDWRITVPTYIAYGTLSISVGWLSEQLHTYYAKLIDHERMAAIGQVALTVRHELNNALMVVQGESEMLVSDAANMTDAQADSVRSINECAKRMARDIEKLTRLKEAPLVSPLEGMQMVDLEGATARAG
jgi:signal transduction histidine kinase